MSAVVFIMWYLVVIERPYGINRRGYEYLVKGFGPNQWFE